jgi:hypothetical protein
METRKDHVQKDSKIRGKEPRPKLQIVKLEERIAPRIARNHNETLVRDR